MGEYDYVYEESDDIFYNFNEEQTGSGNYDEPEEINPEMITNEGLDEEEMHDIENVFSHIFSQLNHRHNYFRRKHANTVHLKLQFHRR